MRWNFRGIFLIFWQEISLEITEDIKISNSEKFTYILLLVSVASSYDQAFEKRAAFLTRNLIKRGATNQIGFPSMAQEFQPMEALQSRKRRMMKRLFDNLKLEQAYDNF